MGETAPPQRGITTIEIIIVLAIVAILVAVGIASLKPPDQVQVDQYLTRVPLIVQKARYDAITRNVFSRVIVDTQGIVLAVDTNPFTDVQSYEDYDELLVGSPGFEAVTITWVSPASTIEFEPRGVPRAGAPISARVASLRNPSYRYLFTISAQGSVTWEREP